MKTRSIQIDKDLHTSYKEYCKNNGYSMQGLVEILIKSKIDDNKEKNKGEGL